MNSYHSPDIKLSGGPLTAGHAAPSRPFELQLRALTDGWLGAMLGALVYAAWAVFANWSAGPQIALRVGITHWLLSTLLTYYGTTMMRGFFGFGRSPAQGAAFAFVCGLAFTYAVLFAVHGLIGTPHIALTLAAGAVPTLLFCSGYALLLMRTGPEAGRSA